MLGLPNGYTIDSAPPIEAKCDGYIAIFPRKNNKVILKPIISAKGRRARPGYYAGSNNRIYSNVRLNEPFKPLEALRDANGQRTLVNIPLEGKDGKYHGTLLNIGRLVLETFVRNPEPQIYTRITHLNHNAEDNRLENLAFYVPMSKRPNARRPREKKVLPFELDTSHPAWRKSREGIRYAFEVHSEKWKPVSFARSTDGRSIIMTGRYCISTWGKLYDAVLGRYVKPKTDQDGVVYVELFTTTGKKKRFNVAEIVFSAWSITKRLKSFMNMRCVKVISLNSDPSDVHLNNLALIEED